MPTSAHTRAVSGADRLDRYFGQRDWAAEIDLDKLDVDNLDLTWTEVCPLGQVDKDYPTGLQSLRRLGFISERGHGREYGFWYGSEKEAGTLSAEWRWYLKQQRERGTLLVSATN